MKELVRVQRQTPVDSTRNSAYAIGDLVVWEVRNDICRTTDYVVWAKDAWLMTFAMPEEVAVAHRLRGDEFKALVRDGLTKAMRAEGIRI